VIPDIPDAVEYCHKKPGPQRIQIWRGDKTKMNLFRIDNMSRANEPDAEGKG